MIHTLPAFSKYSRKRLTSFSKSGKNLTFDLKNFTFIYFLPFLFLLFLFSFTLSRFVHVWGQGYRVTGGESKAPLFLFLYPWTIRDISLNLSLWKRRDSVPRFVPRQGQGHFDYLIDLSLILSLKGHVQGQGTFRYLSLEGQGHIEFCPSICPSICPCPYFCPSSFFGEISLFLIVKLPLFLIHRRTVFSLTCLESVEKYSIRSSIVTGFIPS